MTSASELQTSSRLASIDCLRGLAVLLVLMHHVIRMSFPEKSLFWLQVRVAELDPGEIGRAHV